MKKVTLSVVAVAISFMAFAFLPAGKKNAISNNVISEMDAATGTCDSRYQNHNTWEKCDRVFTEDLEPIGGGFQAQNEVLDKY